jgi:hypothetical protein
MVLLLVVLSLAIGNTVSVEADEGRYVEENRDRSRSRSRSPRRGRSSRSRMLHTHAHTRWHT